MSLAFEKELASPKGLASSDPAAAWWDRTGLATSLICVIHCLATPIALVLLPATGSWLASPLVHQFLAIAVIAAAAGSLFPSYLVHRRIAVLLPAVVGMSAVLYFAFATNCCGPDALHLAGISAGSVGSIFGGLCLMVAHINNLRLLSGRRCC